MPTCSLFSHPVLSFLIPSLPLRLLFLSFFLSFSSSSSSSTLAAFLSLLACTSGGRGALRVEGEREDSGRGYSVSRAYQQWG